LHDGSATNSSQATAGNPPNRRPDKTWMVEMAIQLLEGEGYSVSLKPEFREWKTPSQLVEMTGLAPSGLWRRLHHKKCPPHEREEGETGRVIRVLPTPQLLKFLAQAKTNGAPLKPAARL
jgi:hypothetical protein